jgi:hypothetical protein
MGCFINKEGCYYEGDRIGQDDSEVDQRPSPFHVFANDQWSLDVVAERNSIIAQYESALDAHLDAVAKADRWRDRFTFALRAGFPNPWQAKAEAFGTWMDECNAQAYKLLNAVKAGTSALPSVDEFIASLPVAP